MGLDLFDLTYQTEEAFDVELTVDDFADLAKDRDVTVGDLYEHLLQKMHLRDVARYDVSLNYELWREIQDVLRFVSGVPPDQIELKTPLGALFPRPDRRDAWQRLGEACRYRLPELDYPQFVRALGFLLAVGMVFIEQIQLWQFAAAKWLWPLLGLLGIWMLVETYLKLLSILAPWRTSFPAGLTTVKDLCRVVLASNYGEICHDTAIPCDDRCLTVWRRLTEILVETLGVDASRITFRSRLVHDLGMA